MKRKKEELSEKEKGALKTTAKWKLQEVHDKKKEIEDLESEKNNLEYQR